MIKVAIFALTALLVVPARSAPLRFSDVAAIVDADAKAAFAGMRVNTYIPDALLVETIEKNLDIPGGETAALFGLYAMIEGCRRQSCMEKAAVIVDTRSRKIAAVALRNYECRQVVLDDSDIAKMDSASSKRAPARCNAEPILDVYVVRGSITPESLQAEREQLTQLRSWGARVGHQGERIQVVDRGGQRP